MSIADDFLDETTELEALVADLSDAQWAHKTAFYGWTIRDEIEHLRFVDALGEVSLGSAGAFAEQVKRIRALQADGLELSGIARRDYQHLDRGSLLAAWRDGCRRLYRLFSERPPSARMDWFGPSMSVRSFATARQMEVWAHGQDIWDVLPRRRPSHDRIRNICELGVRTHGWSFRNRGLEPPAAAPIVELTGPSGARWLWNDGSSGGSIRGLAEDFALVVTQRRHVADTGLIVSGADAAHWMRIAQCFAGAAADGPAQGTRVVRDAA